MDIEIFGGGERTRHTARLLSQADFARDAAFRLIRLFPIPTSRDGTHITGTDDTLIEALSQADGMGFNIGYSFPAAARRQMELRGERFYDAAKDEKFLVDNAYISALGTLCYLLCTSARVPSDMSFGIVGYGRIGSALSRMLLFFGASIHIFTSKPLTRIELGECGIDTSETLVTGFDFEDLSGIDILINTAPCDLSYVFPEKRLCEGLRVIDLASGDSFKGVDGVEYLPSIPERMYPESAGRIYADRALEAIKSMRT